ncbi:hypothetical protein, partial [Microvirga aerophila]|uniref:hypothetical protein n=1 Tax=Microvirga aerophila TaxID=670291 RepID=UPI001AEC86EA
GRLPTDYNQPNGISDPDSTQPLHALAPSCHPGRGKAAIRDDRTRKAPYSENDPGSRCARPG